MSRRGRNADDEPLAEINVTPFVDVVLVLLIIFMITAAVVEFGMQVSVPPTTTVSAKRPALNRNVVSIGSEGNLFYDGSVINIYAIADRAKSENPAEPAVYLRIHKLASYDVVAQVLAECKSGGVKINLIPKPLTREPRG